MGWSPQRIPQQKFIQLRVREATYQFSDMQLGSHEWLMYRPKHPFLNASIYSTRFVPGFFPKLSR
jgi:hypothetical protein